MNKTVKGYAIGVMSALIAVGGVAYARSGQQNIDVTYDNYKVYIDNTLADLTDANGTTVEPFVYNGTTYLPVRGVAQAMGAQVTYDGPSKSVYIWDKMVPGETLMMDVCQPYAASSNTVLKCISSEGHSFEMDGKKRSNGMYFEYGGNALFNLDGRFNSLSLDVGHVDNLEAEKTISFIVDGRTVKMVELEPEQLTEHVTIPLNYGLQLKIVTEGYDVGLADMIVE